jgi:simple sugar transport system permease protein
MSETSTAEKTPPPTPPDQPERDRGGALAYLVGHQSAVVIVVALVISLAIGAALRRAGVARRVSA